MVDELTEFFGEVISKYTSEQGVEDGLLVETHHPIINYVTANVYDKCIKPFAEPMKILGDKNPEKNLLDKLLFSVIIEMQKLKPDWFYSIEARGWKFFVAQNETGKYTLMFPEDY